jgi:hypothetical protein
VNSEQKQADATREACRRMATPLLSWPEARLTQAAAGMTVVATHAVR